MVAARGEVRGIRRRCPIEIDPATIQADNPRDDVLEGIEFMGDDEQGRAVLGEPTQDLGQHDLVRGVDPARR